MIAEVGMIVFGMRPVIFVKQPQNFCDSLIQFLNILNFILPILVYFQAKGGNFKHRSSPARDSTLLVTIEKTRREKRMTYQGYYAVPVPLVNAEDDFHKEAPKSDPRNNKLLINVDLIMKYFFILLFFSSFANAQIDSIDFEQSKIMKSEFIEVIKGIMFRQPTDSNVHQLLNSENCMFYLNSVAFANSFLGTILNLDKEENKITDGFYTRISNKHGESNKLIRLKKKDFKRLQSLMSDTRPEFSFYRLNNSSIHNEVELIIWYKNREIVGGIYISGMPKLSDTIINKNYFLKLRELILQLNPPKRL